MRKLRLEPDRLTVDSYALAADAPAAACGHAATPLCVNTLPVNECLTQDTFRNC